MDTEVINDNNILDNKSIYLSITTFINQAIIDLASNLSLDFIQKILKESYDIEKFVNELEDNELDKDDDLIDTTLLDNLVIQRNSLNDIQYDLINNIKKFAESFKLEGNALFKTGDFNEAIIKYNEAINLVSSDPLYYTNRALAYSNLNSHESSILDCDKAIAIDNTNLKAHVIKIKSLVSIDNISEALKTFNDISNIYYDHNDVVELSKLLAESYKKLGNESFKLEKYDDALDKYTKAIELDGENYLYYSNRCACYQNKRMWKEAIDDATIIIELNPKFPKGYIHMCRSLIQTNKLNDAQSYLQQGISVLSPLPEWPTIKPQFDELTTNLNRELNKPNEPSNDKKRAETLKWKGNDCYQNALYQDAIRYYSQAIALNPDEGTYYGNRAASWLMLNEFNQAINDCNSGLKYEKVIGELDKLRLRKITCYIQIGKLDEAIDILVSRLDNQTTPKNLNDQLISTRQLKTNYQSALQALDRQEFSRSKRLFEQLQTNGITADPKLFVALSKSHFHLKDYENSSKYSQKAINLYNKQGGDIDAYVIRGDSLMMLGLTEQSIKYYTAAIQLDPDNQQIVIKLKSAKRIQSETSRLRKLIVERMNQRDYQTAINYCSEGLLIDKTCMKLMAEMHYNRSKAYQHIAKTTVKPVHSNTTSSNANDFIDNLKKALQDAGSAIYYDRSMLEAIYLKVKLLQSLNRHEEAVNELEQTLQLENVGKNNEEVNNKLTQAKMLLKRSLRTDLYTLLGIEKGSLATNEEIKKAYKKSALKWHPDRHAASNEDTKKEAEQKFKLIQNGFELLSDPMKRKLYDQGYDVDEIEERVSMEKQRYSNPHGYR